MSANSVSVKEKYKKVKTILVSQPKPARSPFFALEEKYNLKIDWRPFIHVEEVSNKEFRRQRIKIEDFTSIIFTSKNAIDHFFRVCEEMRHKMSQDTKYFCLSEAIANYLQKFIVYRKRKVFTGRKTISDLKAAFMKHKDKEKFLLPMSNLGATVTCDYLNELELDWTDSIMYKTVASDLSDLEEVFYDVLVFYSPLGISSLYENFPKFEQNETRIAVFGNKTSKAVEEHGLTINIKAPMPESPSMTMALEKYIQVANKK
jgi:uroporphyrinogen-III synthase